MADKLTTHLAAASNEEDISRIMKDHEGSLEVLEARLEREKYEQMEALNKRLAERRNKKMTANRPIHVRSSITCH